ncbi:hypothetical protein FQA39_LY04589 [Lamprigera yunnana]|nr:hypothetical protein FQA39_LY04589 [Lamprigera yunnana]
MKLLLLLMVIMSLATVHGWQSIEETSIHPKFPNHCISKNEEVGKMKFGESKRLPNNCVNVTCEPGKIMYFGCGTVNVDNECTFGTENLSLQYPDCCPQPVCPE